MLDVATSIISCGVRMAVPFLLTALGETITERSGVRNLGLEGIMLVSAFGSFCGAICTGDSVVGLLVGFLLGGLMGALMAVAVVRLGANQLIAGVMITTLGTGLSSFLYQLGFGRSAIVPLQGFREVAVPILSAFPVLGPSLFRQNPLVYMSFLAVPAVGVFLFRTKFGLKIRACGENPRAAESVGIDVYRVRYLTLVLGSMMAGLAGSYLVLADLKWFSHGMSAGRGWIALGIVIFSKWTHTASCGIAFSLAGYTRSSFGCKVLEAARCPTSSY